MATVVLDAYSKAYPSITNRLRASVFLESDPIALVDTIIEDAPHNERIWHFPGLPRANYGFSLDEIDGGGAVIQNLALFSVTPPQINGTIVRGDEQIKVGTTPGFDTGLSTVMFDGGEVSPGVFRPDYRSWEITPSELTGRGILAEGLDYSWNPTTGEFILLQPGDALTWDTYWNIHFHPKVNTAGGSEPSVIDFSARVITADDDIEVSDFGNTIIVEPAGVYVELTLPDITTVPQGRPVTIETIKAIGDGVSCVNILPLGADEINFLRGNLYMMNNESLQIYRFRRDDLSNEWRVRLTDGNFKTVGQTVSDDQIQSDVYCKQALNGASKDKFQYARIYNEFVLELPLTQVVNYDDWATGNNKYFFSLANSANPGDVNKFKFPDRRGLFEKGNNAGKAGDFEAEEAKITYMKTTGTPGPPGNLPTGLGYQGANPNIFQFRETPTIVGTKTVPNNYANNKYVLI